MCQTLLRVNEWEVTSRVPFHRPLTPSLPPSLPPWAVREATLQILPNEKLPPTSGQRRREADGVVGLGGGGGGTEQEAPPFSLVGALLYARKSEIRVTNCVELVELTTFPL